MPIPLTEYLSAPPARQKTGPETCVDCGIRLQESIVGYRPTTHGAKCSDCYFDSLSDLVDQYPIGRPVAVRGTTD